MFHSFCHNLKLFFSFSDENKSLSFPGNQTHKRDINFCQEIYVKSCRHFETVPSTYFFRRLKRSHINLSHHGLGTEGVRSVAVALVVSDYTKAKVKKKTTKNLFDRPVFDRQ